MAAADSNYMGTYEQFIVEYFVNYRFQQIVMRK